MDATFHCECNWSFGKRFPAVLNTSPAPFAFQPSCVRLFRRCDVQQLLIVDVQLPLLIVAFLPCRQLTSRPGQAELLGEFVLSIWPYIKTKTYEWVSVPLYPAVCVCVFFFQVFYGTNLQCWEIMVLRRLKVAGVVGKTFPASLIIQS